MRKRVMGCEFITMRKSDRVRVHYKKMSNGVRVDHEKKSDRATVHHEKEQWGESSP